MFRKKNRFSPWLKGVLGLGFIGTLGVFAPTWAAKTNQDVIQRPFNAAAGSGDWTVSANWETGNVRNRCGTITMLSVLAPERQRFGSSVQMFLGENQVRNEDSYCGLVVEDFNFDGWSDIAYQYQAEPKQYRVFLFVPEMGRFFPMTDLEKLPNIRLDTTNKTLYATRPMNEAEGVGYRMRSYHWQYGTLVVDKETHEFERTDGLIRRSVRQADPKNRKQAVYIEIGDIKAFTPLPGKALNVEGGMLASRK